MAQLAAVQQKEAVVSLLTLRMQTLRGSKAFASDRSGMTAVHYALLAALIALVIVPGVGAIGNSMNKEFDHMAKTVGGPAGGGASASSGAAGGGAGEGGGAGDSSDGGGAGGAADQGGAGADSGQNGSGSADGGNSGGGKKDKKDKKKKKKKHGKGGRTFQ